MHADREVVITSPRPPLAAFLHPAATLRSLIARATLGAAPFRERRTRRTAIWWACCTAGQRLTREFCGHMS